MKGILNFYKLIFNIMGNRRQENNKTINDSYESNDLHAGVVADMKKVVKNQVHGLLEAGDTNKIDLDINAKEIYYKLEQGYRMRKIYVEMDSKSLKGAVDFMLHRDMSYFKLEDGIMLVSLNGGQLIQGFKSQVPPRYISGEEYSKVSETGDFKMIFSRYGKILVMPIDAEKIDGGIFSKSDSRSNDEVSEYILKTGIVEAESNTLGSYRNFTIKDGVFIGDFAEGSNEFAYSMTGDITKNNAADIEWAQVPSFPLNDKMRVDIGDVLYNKWQNKQK